MRSLRTVGFIFLSLILMMGVYIAYFQINPEIRVGEYILSLNIQTLEQFEEESDLILLARMKGSAQSLSERFEALFTSDISKVFSLYEVVETYQGEALSSTIKVLEPYDVSINEYLQKVVTSMEGYRPSKRGSLYLLFLRMDSDEFYVLTGAHQGRYPMNDSVIEKVREGLMVTGEDLEIGDRALKANYLNLYKSAIEKYID